MINLEMDGKRVEAREKATILEAAREAGIEIPTLCHHDKLAPYGACRICSVEITKGGRTRIVAACGYPVEEGLVVKTRSPRLNRLRKLIIEMVAPMAKVGESPVGDLRKLAHEYGANLNRFVSWVKAEPTRCILCGLCVRYCEEVAGADALGFIGRGIEREVVSSPEVSNEVCQLCQECFDICPTGKLRSENLPNRLI